MAKFFKSRDGKWHHKRIDAELLKAIATHETRVELGKKGAAARWKKPPPEDPEMPMACGRHSRPHTQSHVQSQSQLHTQSQSTKLVLQGLVQAVETAEKKKEKKTDSTFLGDMDEHHLIRWLIGYFGADFMEQHGGSWRVRLRENRPKLLRVIDDLRSQEREDKRFRSRGAAANDLWEGFE